MPELPANIESLTTFSPLLKEEIIEKDYTKGIDPTNGQTQEQVVTDDPAQQQPIRDGAKVDDYKIDVDAAKLDDKTKGFAFDPQQQATEQGEPRSGEPSPPGFEGTGTTAESEFKLPESTAKEFAEMIGGAFAIYVPQLSHTFVKIDISNIKWHIVKGNIEPEFESVFNEVNRNCERDLKFSEEEMKLFVHLLQKYLEYKNAKWANPETAFWANVGILATKQIHVINKLMNENYKLVYNAIMSKNPDYFARKGKPDKPESEKPEAEKEETDEKGE